MKRNILFVLFAAMAVGLLIPAQSRAEYGDCIKTWYTSDANKDYYGGLAWRGDYWTGCLYENHSETKHLLKLDPTVPDGERARVLSSIQYTGSTSAHGDLGLAWDSTNNCWWLTDPWAKLVYRLDADGGGWLSSFYAIPNTHGLHFDEENTLLYCSSNVKDYFRKYDVSNPNNPVNVGGNITTGGDIPFAAPGIVVVGDKIWVTTDESKSIYELNLDGTRTGRRIRIPESPSSANAAMLTFDGRYIWVRGNVSDDDQMRIYQMDIGLPPVGTPTPITTPTPVSPIIDSGDYNGDSTSDIAVFRASSGLWAIRGITRAYFGANGDVPAPGDYDGDGSTDIALFRASSGLWAVKSQTRVYFGASGDTAVPGDYRGEGTCDSAIFRPASGLWAIRGITRVYFGASSDKPVPVYASGRSMGKDIAIFRPSSGLWAVRGLSRTYFGASSDTPVAGNYTATYGNLNIGIFRNSSGLWAIKDLTRAYFGSSNDQPVPGNYTGFIPDDIGIFRASSGLWAIKGNTRVYFGTDGDIPVSGLAINPSSAVMHE